MKINCHSSKLWFTADHHFGHESRKGGIIEYCKRPFDTIEEMDQHLIVKWNEVVEEDHYVYYLSDFTLGKDAGKYFDQLKGTIYVLANSWHHDRRWMVEAGVTQWSEVINPFYQVFIRPALEVLEVSGLTNDQYPLPITLCHYPIAEWDRKHYGAFHLHGHSHGKYKGKGKILDVGVDNIYKLLGEYRPINLEEVIEYMKKVEAGFWGQWLRYIPALRRVWE